MFVVKGSLDLTASQKCKIKANELVPLDLMFQEWPMIEKISLSLPNTFDHSIPDTIKTTLSKGNTPLEFCFEENNKKLQLVAKESIAIDTTMIGALEKMDVVVKVLI